jgi:hypothetical protein
MNFKNWFFSELNYPGEPEEEPSRENLAKITGGAFQTYTAPARPFTSMIRDNKPGIPSAKFNSWRGKPFTRSMKPPTPSGKMVTKLI